MKMATSIYIPLWTVSDSFSCGGWRRSHRDQLHTTRRRWIGDMWPADSISPTPHTTDKSKWVSIFLTAYFSTIRLYSVNHVGSCWKIQDRRQIKNTDDTETKRNSEKANIKTKLPRFSHLLRDSARKRGGLILQCSRAHVWHKQRTPKQARRQTSVLRQKKTKLNTHTYI